MARLTTTCTMMYQYIMTNISSSDNRYVNRFIMPWIFNLLSLGFIDAILIYISSSTFNTVLVSDFGAVWQVSGLPSIYKNRVKCWRWYIYQYSINENHGYKKTKIQDIMNWLIYWLSEELMFVMIYQCHHCCVFLLVRRQQKNIFVRESTLFTI